ncbi:elongation factor G [Actinomadura fibrosa]|uniref:GTP-binding protein n=1 Tax=Actinomadura fibrosa TaxID=111802 RepID=A0ABW2X9K3_9ACTN|nr:TetM/TetW/TetO/TetS family tetracycline resistance ribosomal protection protein [Actinomadura fibrosa]
MAAPATATLNLGILAHVDAGKTSLTERLLYDTGAIDRLGSVDAGDTRTDRGELERARGITIRSAVATFRLGALRVNLIDTPGHADFVAEVERALGVLDGAVLVLSAVEGVQARTRVLMRTLRELELPTLLFVNKIDRAGAQIDGTLDAVRRRLSSRIVPLNDVRDLGSAGARTAPRAPGPADAELLADADDGLLASLVDGRDPAPSAVRAALRAQTAAGLVHPLYFGSALTGQGVADLLDGIADLLPAAPATSGDPCGTVFAVERTASGEKVAYLRLFAGELRNRQRVTLVGRDGPHDGRITGLDIAGAELDPATAGAHLTAGNIARVHGLTGARVGDRIGTPQRAVPAFAPPSLETIARARRPRDSARLRAALLAFADEDPLIRARPASGGATSLLLYGEVQKEIIGARLLAEHGVEAAFEKSTTVYLERPVGVGEAEEDMNWRHRRPDFWATIGLRVEPGPPGSGITYHRETELGALPHAFDRAIEETVHRTLERGLHGWPVTDCRVTLTRSGFAGPVSTASDFRGLTPIVLMRALATAKTRVEEPRHRFEAEIPADTLAPVLGRLAALGASQLEPVPEGDTWTLRGVIPASRTQEAEQALPGLTRGEGVFIAVSPASVDG